MDKIETIEAGNSLPPLIGSRLPFPAPPSPWIGRKPTGECTAERDIACYFRDAEGMAHCAHKCAARANDQVEFSERSEASER